MFGLCTFSALAEADFGEYFIVRLMLGEFAGGYKNVEILPYSKSHAEYDSPMVAKNPADQTSSTAENQLPPDETVPAYRITLDSAGTALVNETPYEPDLPDLSASPRTIPPAADLYAEYGTDAPLVLILHTHGTEAYSECAGGDYRSDDITENVVSCGKVIESILEERGIVTIHSQTMHDFDDFTMAYYSASLEIKRITEEYPSVSYIIDVHRDSILSDGRYLAPSVEAEEGYAAQMMFVVGTDHGGSGHTTWENNLALALRLQNSLNRETPQLMRTINLRSASFNEQYSDGSLLLEIGACGSSLEEARRSAALFAHALADEIIG